jgi:hypothetical protein
LDHKENCFHRILYLFCCQDFNCANRNRSFRVLRTQQQKFESFAYDKNDRLSIELLKSNLKSSRGYNNFVFSYVVKTNFTSLSIENQEICFCGLSATKKCANCSNTFYCSKSHQKLDWKLHKQFCKEKIKALDNSSISDRKQAKKFSLLANGFRLLTERRFVIEPEPSFNERLQFLKEDGYVCLMDC